MTGYNETGGRGRCPLRGRLLLAPLFVALSVGPLAGDVLAGYGDWIGYAELQSQLGSAIPTGSGIAVQHVEAPVSGGQYMPSVIPPTSTFYLGKSFTNVTNDSSMSQGNTGVSGHANMVGRNFYGIGQSIAPGIDTISNYEANHWLGLNVTSGSGTPHPSGFLNINGALPDTTSARVASHSWIGQFGSSASDSNNAQMLRRLDYVVERDDFLQIAGIQNGTGTARPLLKSAFNAISVGRTDGSHREGTVGVDLRYTAGREAPTIVAPGGTTSSATPMVAAAAALLLETGQDSALSNGTITNRTRTINHAETSEVLRATLMAGADRYVNFLTGPSLLDYSIDTSNNLDLDYGAGQVNIFNSYNILAAGEQDSAEDGGTGLIDSFGWDYDASFGGVGSSNGQATYAFTASGPAATLFASLVWNLEVSSVAFNGATTLYDLDLELWDMTQGTQLLSPGASSSSLTENTENIYFDGLIDGNDYQMRVVTGLGQGAFDWDYGLSWRVQSIPEPSSVALILVATACLLVCNRFFVRRTALSSTVPLAVKSW